MPQGFVFMTGFNSVLRRFYDKFINKNSVSSHVGRGLKIGRNVVVQKDVVIDYSHVWHIEIGSDVTIAPRVIILAHDASTKNELGYTRVGKVMIGSRVFIGAGTIILPGVSIGDDVIIGAGSVVSRDIESNSVVVGNPARVLCTKSEFLEKKKIEMSLVPCFDESYTLRGGVSRETKAEMNEKMKDRIGYVV